MRFYAIRSFRAPISVPPTPAQFYYAHALSVSLKSTRQYSSGFHVYAEVLFLVSCIFFKNSFPPACPPPTSSCCFSMCWARIGKATQRLCYNLVQSYEEVSSVPGIGWYFPPSRIGPTDEDYRWLESPSL